MEKFVYPFLEHGKVPVGLQGSPRCSKYEYGLALVVRFNNLFFQVLISIQSMILCDEPYLNEPAWAGSSGTLQSKACN